MKIYLAERTFDGTNNINVSFQCDQEDENIALHWNIVQWVMMSDVWGTTMTKYGADGIKGMTFELPASLKNFLYEDDFKRMVAKFRCVRYPVEVIANQCRKE